LWVTAAIGLCAGVGDFSPAIATTVIMLVALVILRVPRNWIRQYLRTDRETVRVVLRPGVAEGAVLTSMRAIDGLHIDSVAVEKEQGAFVILAQMRADATGRVPELLSPIARLDDVDTLRVGGTGE
jgi:uncharacterized membrane protein YhiD involved in acid resistance